MKNRTKLISVILLMALASCAIVYATIVIQQQVSTQIQILAAYGMEVLDVDGTLLTSIDFGSLYRGQSKQVPLPFPPGYDIVNTGEAEIWISYTIEGWPEDVSIKVEGSFFGSWYPDTVHSNSLAPGENTGDWYFYVVVGDTADFGSYTPTITFNAHDSSTG